MRKTVLILFFLISAFIGCREAADSFKSNVKFQQNSGQDVANRETVSEIFDEGSVETCEYIPTEKALQNAGKTGENEALIFDGKRVTPKGEVVILSGWSFGITKNGKNDVLYIVSNQNTGASVQVVDLKTKSVVQKITGLSTYRGVQFYEAKKYLFVGGGRSGKLYRFAIKDDGTIDVDSKAELFLGGYIADVLVFDKNSSVFVMSTPNSKIFEVDADNFDIKRVLKTGTYPYDMELIGDNYLAVSNLSSSTVHIISLVTSETVKSVDVGKNPENLAYFPALNKLYVSPSDESRIDVIDCSTFELDEPISLITENDANMPGIIPQGIAVDSDNMLLFVNIARKNEVRVIDLSSSEIIGRIPTGWYPTENLFDSNSGKLYVISSKGFGTSPYKGDKVFVGLLSILDLNSEILNSETLASYTEQSIENNSLQNEYFETVCKNPDDLFPGISNPIKHVVLIVRENKTYDMVLGDFERGNGDPDLCIFGKEITPNFHKLAEEFTNFDNFYSNPEVSIQGHMWTTQSDCNDYVNKTYRSQIPVAGYEVASISKGGTIFDNCYENGVSFRNYGEFASFGPYLMSKYKDFIDVKFPFYNMDILDVYKAKEFIRELELGIFPQFIYIGLPNDHTYGTTPGKPTPQFMVADNDRATGMIVEAISKSKYWESTVIFIIEDDPQGSGDHVDAHRSLCLAISPWVKRKYTTSVHYSIPNLYKTIELLLGLPPMNINDAEAIPMYDIFTIEPDFSPFKSVPQNIKLEYNTEKSPMAKESLKLDFSKPDGAEGLGEILWKAMKGDVPIPPYAKRIDE